MTPTPQEHGSMQTPVEKVPQYRVVISGMAGLYPRARYVTDLEKILYNKVNPISAEGLRWQYDHPEAAQYAGNVPELDRFDAQFFKVHFRLGNNMDSMSRKMLEQAYEAIYDAGISPSQLSGKKVGVYIGSCFSETEKACFYDVASRTGFGIAGCSKSMFANRISYWLNVKGPSVSIDVACCSSMVALEQAYQAIARGECEAAIVGGSYLCLHPQSSVHYARIMKTSTDGKTRSFAQDAAGCAKSEAINVLFLQDYKHAKRIYADVVHVKSEFVAISNDETGPKFGFYRKPEDTANFLTKFYDEAGISPDAVQYVEAFGSAIPDADKSELEAIDQVFCHNREKPLLVGSVMSNIGYGEASSGISAITKVLLGFQRGELAGNLHCENPRHDVSALNEGRIRIITDNEQFQGSYAAVNSLSVTGINSHVLLNAHYKPKDRNRYATNIPRLVTISARQESSVKRVLEYLKSQPIDPEELALLHNIHETSIAGHLGRGFTILDTDEDQKTICLSEKAEYFDDSKRPLWFVYSGMGSQWAGMGAQLLRIPIFAAAIERCRLALEPKGIDIVKIITSPDKSTFDNILHSFVGIAAIQIGLTDILLSLGIVPDKIIGHSVGELGCAYADGCLTAEEMILSAYSRGRVSLETPFIQGSMAAVGIGYTQMSTMCPPEIEIACHNSADSCTISGPTDVMRNFVAELTAKGIFAKEVPCSNIAYHSRYIADAGPGLLKYLKEVIPVPKARSERWVSSSVPQNRWDEAAAKYSSADYHTNNLLSPVLFEETSRLIPSNAVLVEVAPHGLLQAILKRSLPESCTNIALTRRGHPDNVLLVLEAVGKLYMNGYNPKVRVLYPDIEFPVSTGTPCLSHLVEWAHQEKWSLPLYQSAHRIVTSSQKVLISIHDDEYKSFKGHVIREKTLVPFSFAIVAVWDTLAMATNAPKKSINVQFRDIKFYAQPILNAQKSVKLSIAIHKGTGWFEIMNENSKVATGFVVVCGKKSLKGNLIPDKDHESKEDFTLSAKDVYRLFYERQYTYSGAFRSIHSASESLNKANVLWEDNWVTFLDSLLQINILKHTTYNGVSQIDRIGCIHINVEKHINGIRTSESNSNNSKLLEAHILDVYNRTSCEGVVIENIQFHDLPLVSAPTTVQSLKFVPRYGSEYDVSTSLKIFLQIVAENLNKDIINVAGLSSNDDSSSPFEEILNISLEKTLPGIDVKYHQIPKDIALQGNKNIYKNVDLIIMKNLSNSDKICQNFYRMLQANTFIVSEEDISYRSARMRPSNLYNVVSALKNPQSQLELVIWKPSATSAMDSAFTARSESDLPLLRDIRNKLSPEKGLIVVTSYPPVYGLMPLVMQWRRDSARNKIHVIMVNEESKDNATLDDLPDVNLAYNIFNNGMWGGEFLLPLEENSVISDDMTLQCEQIGHLDSLRWVPAPKWTEPGTLVKVHYAGINSADVQRALGVNSKNDKNSFGIEFSGVTERGERVMGIVNNGAASSEVTAQPDLMWPVPSYWTLEDAATVPFAYIYAYYCLLKSKKKPIGKAFTQYTVLVHGATGALGQAAINICLSKGYRVFATVSDLRKKRYLMRLNPELREQDIGNSRDTSFLDLVLSATKRQGCNLIFCCLRKDFKDISMKCGGTSSLMCDTSHLLNNENYVFGMNNLSSDKSYLAIDIATILGNAKSEEIKILHGLVSDGICSGEVRPLSRVTYSPTDAARAFRLLAASRHRGRVLLRLRDSAPHTIHRVSSAKVHSHIVLCDEQPLGLQLTEKLISSGRKRIHLHFQKQPAHLQHKLRTWHKLGAIVTTTHGELNNIKDIKNMFDNAMSSGTVEGIYVTANNVIQPNIMTNLNLAVSQYCPSLKHFLILTNDYNKAIQRTPRTLAVVLDVSKLDSFQDEDGLIWYRGAPETALRALQCSDAVVIAQPNRSSRLDLVQEIAKIADLNIYEETPSKASLEELGMVLEKSEAVSAFLKDMHNTYIDVDEIPGLTLEKIRKIELRNTDSQFKKTKGLETFYSYVDSDELLATVEMTYLPTLTNSSTMREDEFNLNETFLCIIPGLEGHHARFRTLCEHLKLPALVLQPGLDRPGETPRELALRYSDIMLKKAGLQKSNKPFYILGYEVGVIVALELAAILEDHGQTGTVFCIGDGPEEIKDILRAELNDLESEEELQIGVMRHMFGLMTDGEAAPASVESIPTWSARVDACVRALLGRVSHSAQYARTLMEAAYARIITARSYCATPRLLRSRLVLLRARREPASESCSLQRYTNRTLQVSDLTAPLAHATCDLQASAIINSCLDDSILKTFEKRNLCDSYLLDGDAFMTRE